MMKIIETTTLEANVTPKQVARLVAEMDNNEQIKFLNHLAELVNRWDCNYAFQLQHITDGDAWTGNKLNTEARDLMRSIGEYADE